MSVQKTINTDSTTYCYQVRFGGVEDPVRLDYTNTIENSKITKRASRSEVIADGILTEEELIDLQLTLQKLADGYNPDKEVE